jgi:hypothetical protein
MAYTGRHRIVEIYRGMSKRTRAAIASVVIVAGIAGGSLAASADPVAVTSVTASTVMSNHPDSGNGTPSTWSYDDFTRTLTVSAVSPQPVSVPAGDTEYNVVVSDTGEFHAIVGAETPNQSTPGTKIARGVTGSLAGTYDFTVTAPTADTLTGIVPATENDNFGAPATTTSSWPTLAFATATGVTVTPGAWSWTYKTGCETWVDSSANGDGNVAADGNITGMTCPVPVLSGGHAVALNPVRENVYFTQSGAASWDHFTIIGPGKINGHQGWVNGHLGVNVAVYGGLEAHHGYTVLYQPVTGQGSTTHVHGASEGYVYFIS